MLSFLNSVASLGTSWVCLRAGWIMRAVHTIFDYVRGQKIDDFQVALATSGWISPGALTLDGGVPPDLSALREDQDGERVEDFVNHLFHNYSNVPGANDRQLQNLLAATVLNWLDQVLVCLKEHPQEFFGDTDEDCFVQSAFLAKLLAAAYRAGIHDDAMETLLRLVKEACLNIKTHCSTHLVPLQGGILLLGVTL